MGPREQAFSTLQLHKFHETLSIVGLLNLTCTAHTTHTFRSCCHILYICQLKKKRTKNNNKKFRICIYDYGAHKRNFGETLTTYCGTIIFICIHILVCVCLWLLSMLYKITLRDRMATKYSHFSAVFCLSSFLPFPFPFFSRLTLIQNLNRNLFCTVILTFRIIFFVHFFLCWKILFFFFLLSREMR